MANSIKLALLGWEIRMHMHTCTLLWDCKANLVRYYPRLKNDRVDNFKILYINFSKHKVNTKSCNSPVMQGLILQSRSCIFAQWGWRFEPTSHGRSIRYKKGDDNEPHISHVTNDIITINIREVSSGRGLWLVCPWIHWAMSCHQLQPHCCTNPAGTDCVLYNLLSNFLAVYHNY